MAEEVKGPYKVVELSTVTDEALESALNEWAQRGYALTGIHFAMRESSKRPAMAFIVFTRPDEIATDNPRPSTSGTRLSASDT